MMEKDYTFCKSSKYGVTPVKLLKIFDESEVKLSMLTKQHATFIAAPKLLPGETLYLQQGSVTCVKTLCSAALGTLHLTNYRIIFAGNYMQEKCTLNEDYLSTLGYRYEEHKSLSTRVAKLKDLVPGTVRSLKSKKNSSKTSPSSSLGRRFSIRHCVSVDDLLSMEKESVDKDDVMVSIPIMSVLEVRKFSKQYLPQDKLAMLRDGVEIITTNFLSVKICLGEQSSYDAEELVKVLNRHIKVKSDLNLFAHAYYQELKYCKLPRNCRVLDDSTAQNSYKIKEEFHRTEIFSSSDWKRFKDQKICSSYPSIVVLPALACSVKHLTIWSKAYQNKCYPIVVWHHRTQRNVLLRAAARNHDNNNKIDEDLLNSIPNDRNKLVVYSQRTSDQENVDNSSYVNIETRYFDNLPSNINTSHECALKLLYTLEKRDDSRYFSSLEESGWLLEVNTIIECSTQISRTLSDEWCSVLVALGSGTDRVAQLSSIAQLLSDHYYRTMDGFQVLIQKEWLLIKHSFTERNIFALSSTDYLSPIFLQFLDCVWQITQQFPTTFEFSSLFLELLAEHAYSCRFGTFLNLPSNKTVSLWSYINVANDAEDKKYFNSIYDPCHNLSALKPGLGVAYMQVWPWFTRFKNVESSILEEDKMLERILLVKLQDKCKELLARKTRLLRSLEKQDEGINETVNSIAMRSSIEVVGSLERLFHPPLARTTGRASEELNRRGIIDKPRTSIGQVSYDSLSQYLNAKGICHEGLVHVVIAKNTCSGYLVKQGNGYKTWKKRWFVIDLQKKTVSYYPTSDCKELKGVFNYLSICGARAKKGVEKGAFEIETYGRTYQAKAETSDVMNVWLACFLVPWANIST